MNLRWGVAGLGRGTRFVEWLSALDGCEVVAVCDVSEAALKRFDGLQTYTDYSEFLEKSDLDVVAVITPGPEHASHSLAAMEAGCHVLSETPCVYSIAEAQAVAAAVERTGLKFMLAEDYIWMGWCQNLKAIVEAGRVGDIVFAEAEYTHDCRGGMLVDANGKRYPASAWGSREDLKPTWRASDLPPLFYCSHTLGPLLYLMQDRCTTALGLNTGAKVAPEVCPVDMESGLLQTEAGCAIRLTNGFCIAHPFSLFTGLYGSRGSIRMVNLGGLQVKAWFEDDPGDGWQDLPMQYQERADGRHWVTVMLEEFIVAIRDDTDPPVDVYRAMEYTLPGICAHLSAEQGGELVAVPDLRPN